MMPGDRTCSNSNDLALVYDPAGYDTSSTLDPSVNTTKRQRQDVHAVIVAPEQGVDDDYARN